METNFYVEASGLKRQVTCAMLDKATNHRSLRGEAVLDSMLGVKSLDDNSVFHFATVTLEISSLEGDRKIGPGLDYDRTPAVLIPDLQNGQFATCALNVWVEAAHFDSIWEASNKHSKVSFKLSVDFEKGASQSLVPNEAIWTRGIFGITVKEDAENAEELHWIRERREYAVRDALRDQYFSSSSQMGKICSELTSSVAYVDGDYKRAFAIEKVRQLLSEIRDCFRGSGSPYTKDRTAFISELNHVEKGKQNDFEGAYDTVWKHYNVADAVSIGQVKEGPVKDQIICQDDRIEIVAGRYLALQNVRSSTLEHILIDSLMYSECLGTAQAVHPVGVHGELTGRLELESSWNVFKRQVPIWLWETFKEVAKLALTYGVARLITLDEVIATWIVISSYTLFRWFRRIFFWRDLVPVFKTKQALDQMTSANTMLARPDFNPRDVRHLIHTLTPMGCRFSPWVLHLLDRRIDNDQLPLDIFPSMYR